MTPAERLRRNQRLLDKAIRELDVQRTKLEKQEKQLITTIRQSAQKNQLGACKIQAKDLGTHTSCPRLSTNTTMLTWPAHQSGREGVNTTLAANVAVPC